MSHHHQLRDDKTCQNCGHFVEDHYCPHCGQENIETRQPFHYLFSHFMEDLTHYDGEFWSSVKDLIRKPGKLTLTYLEGKRKKYVVPVKLYIFISFIAFFLPGILPSFNHKTSEQEIVESTRDSTKIDNNSYQTSLKTLKVLHETNVISDSVYKSSVASLDKKLVKDTIQKKEKKDDDEIDVDRLGNDLATNDKKYLNSEILLGAKNREEYDSIIAKKPTSKWGKAVDFIQHQTAYKLFEWNEEGVSSKELKEKAIEHFIHNLPKLLFVYMPFFAFLLWIMIDKKRFWYFDCGIFTLHYFSFLLLIITIAIVLGWLLSFIHIGFITAIETLFFIFLFFYSIIYFFKAYKRVFQKHRLGTIGHGILLFIVNMFFMLLFLIGYVALTIYMLH